MELPKEKFEISEMEKFLKSTSFIIFIPMFLKES